MAKEWDSLVKLLAVASPQELVSFVLPGATYQSDTFTDLPAQSREIQADVMYNVVWEGIDVIVHIEFQRRHDEDMAKRVWQYNALATIIKKLPVFTFVIYLVKDHGIVPSPYQQIVHGRLIRDFYFTNILLWDVPMEVFKQPNLEGLLPLLPLAKDGAQRSVVDDMILGLQQADREKLLPLAFAFAALIFTEDDDRQWLKRRFEMLHDILESSWAYQEMVQTASEKAAQKALQQGRDEERQKALQQDRQVLTLYVEKQFPALVPLLKRQIDATNDPEVLQRLLIELFSVSDTEEAERTILQSFALPE